MSEKFKPTLDQGEIITIKGADYEVLHISLNQDAEHPLSFHYELVLKSEADAFHEKNEAEAVAQKAYADERAELEKEALQIGITDITEQRFPTNDSLREAINLLKEYQARQEQIRAEAAMQKPVQES